MKIYLSVVTGASGSGGGGGGTTTPTNLGVSRDASNVVVTSSTGTDATLPAASVTQAGRDDVRGQERSVARADGGGERGYGPVHRRLVGRQPQRSRGDRFRPGFAGRDLGSRCARRGNELALKSELPTVDPTNLSVVRAASQVTIASSTGTDAVLPAATATEAGAMSGTDKTKLTNAIESAAAVGSGNFVSGAGGRAVREATSADLTSLAMALSDGARGTAELALKSEIGSGGGLGSAVTLVDNASLQPTILTGGCSSNFVESVGFHDVRRVACFPCFC